MDVDEEFDVDETTSGDDGLDDDGQPTNQNATGNNTSVTISSYLSGRYKKLGFHPQKEIFCNKYLPYADQLDDESQRMLADVKEFLAVAVATREMVPAITTAVKQLMM